MTRVEPLHATHTNPLTPVSDTATSTTPSTGGSNLRDAVQRCVRDYLADLDGQISTDVYQMVLAQVEAPLLTEIMAYTRNNQTKASHMLGLNRGTLRKKLKQYDLLVDKK